MRLGGSQRCKPIENGIAKLEDTIRVQGASVSEGGAKGRACVLHNYNEVLNFNEIFSLFPILYCIFLGAQHKAR